MDLQELKIKYPLLLSYMEAQNYSWQYIKHIKNESLWILRESGNYDWKTYDDIYQTCVEKYTNKYTLNYKRKMLLVIKRFVLESVVPDGSLHTHIVIYIDVEYDIERKELETILFLFFSEGFTRHFEKKHSQWSEYTEGCIAFKEWGQSRFAIWQYTGELPKSKN